MLSRSFSSISHIIQDRRRITPSEESRSKSLGSSLIQIKDERTGAWHAGELTLVLVPSSQVLPWTCLVNLLRTFAGLRKADHAL